MRRLYQGSKEQMAVNSYDQLPYPSLCYAPTHPDRLATLATLLGMSPPAVDRCRVLELGCAVGGNLIPMAYALPGSLFVGIDASAVQIAAGQETVAALGLENIALKQKDILEVDASLGEFDYIIVHGVYSWVPPGVQDQILRICKESLAPNGVSYVSYNTYPGWHMIEIVRGIMLFQSRGTDDPEERASRGRSGLRLLAELGPGESSAYGLFLKTYAQLIDGELEDSLPKSNSLLFHDEMSEFNSPLYFYQFAERAASHGLQYLGDFHHMRSGSLPPETVEKLQSMAGNHIELEQYLDFMQNRTFRQTLLCHDQMALNRSVKPHQAMAFHARSTARSESPEVDLHSVSVERFLGSNGAVLSMDHPLSKAAMLCLAAAWPRALSFGDLLAAARARLGLDPVEALDNHDVDTQVLSANLLKAYGYSSSLMDLHVYAPPMAGKAGERPVASAVARLLAGQGSLVTNLWHERITLDPLVRFLLPYLDGSRNRDALLDLLLAGPVADGVLTVEQDGEQPTPIRDVLAVELEACLNWVARAGLLIEPSLWERANETG